MLGKCVLINAQLILGGIMKSLSIMAFVLVGFTAHAGIELKTLVSEKNLSAKSVTLQNKK